MAKQLYWVETATKNSLSARLEILTPDNSPVPFFIGVSEKHMDPIQEWCEQNNCGIRTSFDTFKFKNKSEITMFLLRWSS